MDDTGSNAAKTLHTWNGHWRGRGPLCADESFGCERCARALESIADDDSDSDRALCPPLPGSRCRLPDHDQVSYGGTGLIKRRPEVHDGEQRAPASSSAGADAHCALKEARVASRGLQMVPSHLHASNLRRRLGELS